MHPPSNSADASDEMDLGLYAKPYISSSPRSIIKKRVRERDGSEDEERLMKRPRANTSTLLPPQPEGGRQDISEPPKPGDDLDRYDRARLQQGLRYVDGAAKRKIGFLLGFGSKSESKSEDKEEENYSLAEIDTDRNENKWPWSNHQPSLSAGYGDLYRHTCTFLSVLGQVDSTPQQ